MKTPDWSQAPEWANYVAMDADGAWYWYSHEPIRRGDCWWSSAGGNTAWVGNSTINWRTSLTSRPAKPEDNTVCTP
jgi:hypothetical protein